jgi:hypothetical protein
MKRSRRLMPSNKRKIAPQSFRGPEIKAFRGLSRESDGPWSPGSWRVLEGVLLA